MMMKKSGDLADYHFYLKVRRTVNLFLKKSLILKTSKMIRRNQTFPMLSNDLHALQTRNQLIKFSENQRKKNFNSYA